MKEIEDMLRDNKKEIDNIKVPDELEMRLKGALRDKKPPKKKVLNWKSGVASILIIFLLVGYNFDTLAYYGKKLIGYDNVMNKTLKELNELEKGQIINKSYTFESGLVVTLDGVMVDKNQMLVFYSFKDPEGIRDVSSTNLTSMQFKGLIGRYNHSWGRGEISDDESEVRWVSSFEPPKFFEKSLDFEFMLNDEGNVETGEISFKLDRSKAMGYTIKKSINKDIVIDDITIDFESITASPTTTVLKGSIEDIFSLALDQIKGERYRPDGLRVKLIANGEEVQSQGSGIKTDMKGITFHQDYDPLPRDLGSLKLKLVSFSADHDVNKTIDLSEDKENEVVNILGEDIEINKIYEKSGETFVTITTNENTVLTRVYLLIDGKRVELNKTLDGELEKLKDGTILNRRTLAFPGTGDDLKLDIVRMSYEKEYNEVIEISLD